MTPIELTAEQEAARRAEVEAYLIKNHRPRAAGAHFMAVPVEQLTHEALLGAWAYVAHMLERARGRRSSLDPIVQDPGVGP
jgi:hypothetical protein